MDRIFELLAEECPDLADVDRLKTAVRAEFAGIETYVRKRTARDDLVHLVLSRFNGRNATQTARELNISRATVYRVLKQSGREGAR